jgi:hypothetical protein
MSHLNPGYVRPPPPKKTPDQIFDDVRREYGEPHFTTKRNPVGTLNEPFWAALYRSEPIFCSSHKNILSMSLAETFIGL